MRDMADPGKREAAAYSSRGSASAPPTIKGSHVRAEGSLPPGYRFRPYVYGGSRSRFALRALAAQPKIGPGQ